jgi:hypothetical protein
MIVRAVAVWFLILLSAVVNGGVRDGVVVPRLGETAGRAISSAVLATLVLLVAWLTIAWIGPGSRREAWLLGALWLGLTLAFEFGAGHYLMGKPWSELLLDYNVLRGRIWVLVLVATLVAPVLAWTVRNR